MAHLPEESKFDEGVYQLEMTDPVVGGPNGISNSPLRNLANRTRWLKDQLATALTNKADRESPQLTGEPTTTAPGESDNSTRIATTGWVRSLVTRLAAPLAHVGSRGSAHAEATTSEAGFMSAADKAKLNGIAAGAQGNTVTSVAGKTGAVTLAVGDVSGALASSHAGAGGNAHALATTSQAGFMSAADKTKLDSVSAGAGAGAVTSVAGRTGAVTLSASDVSGLVPASGGTFSGRIYAGLADYNPPNDNSVMTYHWLKKYGVLSVAGKKGAVTLSVSDVSGAAPSSGATLFDPTLKVSQRGGLLHIYGSVSIGNVDQFGHKTTLHIPDTNPYDLVNEKSNQAVNVGYITRKVLKSGVFQGEPKATTAGNSDNSTRIATTAWVWNAIATIADARGMSVSGNRDRGYVRLPSWLWGITFQWVRVASNQRGHLHGSWPIAFPNECYMTVGNPRFGTAHAVVAVDGDRTRFSYESPGNTSGSNVVFNILSIGR